MDKQSSENEACNSRLAECDRESHLIHVQKLFIQHMSELRGWMMTMIPCSSTVDDLVQETFLTVHQKADSFSAGTNFRAWVFTIARYKVLSASRRPELREKCFEPETIERLMDEVPQFEVDSPHLRALSRCIGKLAPKARRAIELRYLSHHKPQAIAVKMNWTVGAINVALSRARVVLRKCIESQVSKDSMPQHSSS